MEETRLMIQSTPNPNALKFVLNTPVKADGNCTYKDVSECKDNLMADTIFKLNPAIKEVYFFDNYITVTQDGNADWDDLEANIKTTIMDQIKDHDPTFVYEEPSSAKPMTLATGPEIDAINSILDQTVRPALQMDGGDIQVVNYEENIVKVFYQGACGSCPSATMGTMKAIENILRDQFNPAISVELAEHF